MTEQQKQAFEDIQREILVGKITGSDTSRRQKAIYRRMTQAHALEVAGLVLAKFANNCGALGGWVIEFPDVVEGK